jgi:hypothetical protein
MRAGPATSFRDQDRFQPSGLAAARTIEDQIYFVHLDDGQYYSAGGLAPTLWQLLSSGQELGAIVAEVEARYPEARAQIRDDVLAFAGELLASGLLVRSP